jgi:hypothetical protein
MSMQMRKLPKLFVEMQVQQQTMQNLIQTIVTQTVHLECAKHKKKTSFYCSQP